MHWRCAFPCRAVQQRLLGVRRPWPLAVEPDGSAPDVPVCNCGQCPVPWLQLPQLRGTPNPAVGTRYKWPVQRTPQPATYFPALPVTCTPQGPGPNSLHCNSNKGRRLQGRLGRMHASVWACHPQPMTTRRVAPMATGAWNLQRTSTTAANATAPI